MKRLRIAGSGWLWIIGLVLLLGACSDSETESPRNGEESGESAGEVKVNPAGTYPIVDEKVTLTVLVRGETNTNFETNAFTQWYEEKTNVHVEWIVAPDKEYEQVLNLALASGDYPDVIMGMGVTPAQQILYGKQGIFLPLNEYMDEYAGEINKAFEHYPNMEQFITAPDGNMYSFPMVNECYHCSMSNKMWINQKWLDRLGLDMPQTTEEFYTVLKSFKEQDPNGNGKADEIPLVGAVGGFNSEVDLFLMNAFIFNDRAHQRMILEDGRIEPVFNKEGWKEGLAYLRRLYSEGLIAPETFTQDRNQYLQLGESGSEPIVGAGPGGTPGFVQTGANEGRWLDYTTVPPLKGPDGKRLAWYNPYSVFGTGFLVITDKAEHPEVAFRWADGFYERETTLRSEHGTLGEYWDWAEEGEVGINGKPAIWKKLKAKQPDANSDWKQRNPSFRSNELRLGEKRNPDNPLEIILYEETKEKYEPYQQDEEKVVPPLYYSEEQAAELADLQTTIDEYITEMIARFVTGDADLESEWQAYVDTLNNMGLERYVQILQESYDAQYK